MPDVPAVPGTDLAAAVTRAFSPDGRLAEAVPGFEPRTAQHEMARAVAGIFAEGGVLLAEAGTGTGKTLAYLVPAILSRTRVLISTGTKNLQEQIYDKDLPALRDALGVAFSATCMKGRGNYLCLHRFDTFRDRAPLTAAEAAHKGPLEAWARVTQTGDRAELADFPEDLTFWNEIAATSDNCLGSECPRYDDCFVTRMRQRAAESDLVIVNHHLLCADAAVRQSVYGEVIPDCSFAVIDEAHQLEDVATQYFGIQVSNYRLDDLVRDGERLIANNLIGETEPNDELLSSLHRLRDRSRAFFSSLSGHVGAASADERIRLTARALEPILPESQLLSASLRGVEAIVGLLKSPSEDALGLGRRCQEFRDQLQFLVQAADLDYVYFLEVRGRGVFLRASPIDVSDIVRELLLDRMRGTILTSATLAVGGSFEFIRSRLGIRDSEEIRLASEFDYREQAIMYLPRSMPNPRSPAFGEAVASELIAIVERTEGRAFGLFTSYATLRQVQAIAERELSFPLLVQGSAPRSVLLQQFRTTPHAVLLGTSSFWQGVDVVGEALSCVVIDKLPFVSPADPITAARIEAITGRGGQPFDEYQVPLAILTLQQGLGRLIRHRQDRGVLAILDPRLRTMGYGRRFMRALPPAPLTHDLADVEQFLGA